ncbi:MAG: amino acid--tRNA ligase-related protein, partial [Patescibacteria group bacterium]
MNSILIKSIGRFVGQEVQLQGWVYNFRSSGKIFFLQLRDGSARVQIVYSKADVPDETWAALESLRLESSVRVVGRVKEDTRASSGFELDGLGLTIIALATDEFPIGKKDHGPDFLLDERHLWLRSESQWAIQRVRNQIINSTYHYFAENDFVKFDSPILTPTSCEGTTELFEMEYFDSGKAYLTQSGQLYLEAGIMSLGRAFDFGPVFRAEKSKTRRHLTEFWMMDAEAAFVDHQGNMQIQEELICRIAHDVLANCGYELKVLGSDTKPLEAIKA